MVMDSSQIWSRSIMEDIHAKAELGRYRIRGFSTFQKITHFDDLTFLSPASPVSPLRVTRSVATPGLSSAGHTLRTPLSLRRPFTSRG